MTPPAIEPITLDEAKLHLRVTGTDDDAYISGLIAAARQLEEKIQNRAFLTTTFRMQIDSFPDLPNATLKFFVPTYSVESYLARAISLMSGPLRLLRSPCISVTSITYLDNNGATQTLAQNPAPGLPGYIVDVDSEPARIAPANNLPWPITQAIQSAVKVTYVAGYGATADKVPETTKHAIKLRIGQFYENREAISDKMSFKVPGLDALEWIDRVYEIP
ncbi:MAG TPA: head-tail connector protein [Candidatus Dormibacteraeota bacterium]|nr:head-tail connector protein [Candidatus Dormibacteraeota bacterium]